MSREEIQTLISTNQVEKLMLSIRGKNVLPDRDVAMLYGVETRVINQAVKNNSEKFPFGYIFELDKYETQQLIENRENFAVKNFDRKSELDNNFDGISSKSRYTPKAFTEKGLLCRTKSNKKAEFSLRGVTQPMGIAQYETEKLFADVASALPQIEEIEQTLSEV